MNQSLKSSLQFVLFLSLGLTILYFVFSKYEANYQLECAANNIAAQDCSLLKKIWADFKSSSWIFIALSVGIYILSNVLRTLRWNLLLQPLGYRIKFLNGFGAIMIGYITSLAIPRIGEVLRAGVVGRYEDIPSEKAFGTIISERVIDFLMLILVSLLAVLISYETIIDYLKKNAVLNVGNNLRSMLLVGCVILALSATTFYFKNQLINSALGQKIIGLVNGMFEGILSIFKMKNRLAFIFYTIGIWLCYFAMTQTMLYALPATANLGGETAMMILLFGSLGLIVPTPGGMGSYHFLLVEALSIFGVSKVDGFSFANLIFFSINIFGNILLGLTAYIVLPILNQKKS